MADHVNAGVEVLSLNGLLIGRAVGPVALDVSNAGRQLGDITAVEDRHFVSDLKRQLHDAGADVAGATD